MTTDARGADHSGARLPPQNIEAEEGLLGAAMLDPVALEVLATTVRPDEFYRPAHRLLADVLVAQYAADAPVDAVTVWDEIERRGAADRVPDGKAHLVKLLSAGAPTMAARYAELVHDHARRRSLAAASAEISELAFDGAPAPEATARALELLARLSEGDAAAISSLEVADISALLEGDLEVEDPHYLTRSDGRCLLYAGKMNEIHAEPSAGKSWFALLAVLEILRMGGAAIYIDWEDTARGILGRLLALGALPEEIRERFAYVQPVGALAEVELGELERLIDRLNPDLVVLDGVAEALAKNGYDEGSNSDVVKWINEVPRRITASGAGVLMIDHVVKDREKGGRYSRGAGAKLAAVDGVSYEMKVIRSFSRTSPGTTKCIVAKDRPGGVGSIGEVAAVMNVAPAADGARVEVRLEVDTKELSAADPWKPTIIMQKVSEELERSEVTLTAAALRSIVHAEKPKLVTQAIARLLAEGYVREAKMGRTVAIHLVRPYRHDGNAPPHGDPPAPDVVEEELPLDDHDLLGNVTPGPWPGSDPETDS